MRNSKTLAKLRANEPVQICALGHFIPAFVRHAAHFGYDCIWLDLEHRAMSDRDVQALLSFFHQFDIDCMLRAPTLEKTKLYRYLEDGATGLMIPHVSTPEKARMLVNAVKFPPIGDRGIDGAGLDSDFYLQGGADYTDAANRETFLVVQIETPEAVANADAIAAVEGVDGLFLGPGDLGLRLAKLDTQLTMDEAHETVAAACKKHGKAWGRPCGTVADMQRFHKMGAQLIAHGGEFGAIMEMLERCSSEFSSLES
ncbi:MAG: aldolase/citrate lyase family protein [Planctomycetota bacterium]|nr:aldolase/citrate lyase family protein [Planctomycetota bacterium]